MGERPGAGDQLNQPCKGIEGRRRLARCVRPHAPRWCEGRKKNHTTPTLLLWGNWGWRWGDVLGAPAGGEQWGGSHKSHLRWRWSIASAAAENHKRAKRPTFIECRDSCGRQWVWRTNQNFDAWTRSVNRWIPIYSLVRPIKRSQRETRMIWSIRHVEPTSSD
jgi:hypothetical protein